MMYMARLANLVVWMSICYLIIKTIPIKKWAVAGMLLLPMFISQAISVGVDVLYVGFLLLFIAKIINIIVSNTVLSKKDYIILLLSACLAVMAKQLAVIFLPAVLLIKSRNFLSRKIEIIYKITLILLPIILLIAWVALSSDVSNTNTIG